MDTIYYQGVWRMDWGLGNPNTTAALIALLMLAVWVLPLLHRWLFWVALPAFTALGMCLMHTMSRGGVVAAAAGFAVLLAHLYRARFLNSPFLTGFTGLNRLTGFFFLKQRNPENPVNPVQNEAKVKWSRIRMLAVAIGIIVMFTGAGTLQTSTRFARSPQDRSIFNRLVIWRQTPRMMVDAPWGWGIGNASRAYMSWYQPLERPERYRVLVNSHLDWLVEFGWPMRLLYVLGWAAVFVICGSLTQRHKGHNGDKRPTPDFRTLELSNFRTLLFCGVVCGMWTAFFVAATFSSVAESLWLWVLPVLGLVGVLIARFRQRLWPSRLVWAISAMVTVLVLGSLAVCGYATVSPVGAEHLAVRRNGVVCVGAQPPKTWVVVDTSADGKATVSELYPRDYRGWEAHPPVGFAPSLAALPSDMTGCRLAVIGTLRDWSALPARAKTCASLLLIAPDAFPDEIKLPDEIPTRVMFGELANRPSATAWQGTGLVQTIEGVGDFFEDWPELVFRQD